MSRYSYKKHYTWSPEISYAVGLMASDGCLQKDGRHLDLTSVDTEQLKNFSLALGRELYIGTKLNGYGGIGYRIQLSDVALYDFLLEVGLTPNKSKTIGALSIPDIYYPDFLRGLFDGDGTIYGFWDKDWPNCLRYSVGFTSASHLFLQWLQTSNSRLAFTLPGTLRLSGRAYILSYGKADSRKLFSFMYYTKNVPKLNRKYQKFIDFLTIDNYPSKEVARVL
jgi:hypothetical protein